jgi:single stranded DNA-binding protein (ssb)
MLNKVLLIGNITRDIEVNYTAAGKAVATLGLASTHKFKSGGEYKEETCYINAVVWGTRAENCQASLHKGDPVLIIGRLQSRQYEKDGQKRSVIEIIVEDIQFITRTKEGDFPRKHGINRVI